MSSMSSGQRFYSTSSLIPPVTRQDVMSGAVIKISPALITLLDRHAPHVPARDHRRTITEQVSQLLDHGVRSFHVDINFGDYSGFGSTAPVRSDGVFDPVFVGELNDLVQDHAAFLTLHLLTDHPDKHLDSYAGSAPGAVCFQLDAVTEPARLYDLVARIRAMGACASPVIETVGTDALTPVPPGVVVDLLGPVLPQIGTLTFQAAGTGARSNRPAGVFAGDCVRAYLDRLTPGFTGTIQLQGGITTHTVGEAVALGAEFLVAGTQIFYHADGLAPFEVIDAMLHAAARALARQ
ncbi:MAG: hypothetical protein JW966_03890 [Anaerolineae bacterium]|nr:hypothetical protein [Anaerolineae bacterium]